APQPQFFSIVGDELFVVNSGAVDFGTFTTAVPGTIDVISISGARTATGPVATIPFGLSAQDPLQGSLSRMAVQDNQGQLTGVVGSGLTSDVYVVDLDARTVTNGVDNPLEVTAAGFDLISAFEHN